MTLRFLSSTTISDGLPSARRAVAVAILALAGATAAHAAPDAASAAAGDQAAPLTITVRPGQSLNDIAVAVTQSHDPAVLARAGRALFDANPQAFMKRDPSRLKIGAQLTVPALDATGAAAGVAASGAAAGGALASAALAASHAAASAGSAGSAGSAAAASHPVATSAASHVAAASGATSLAALAASGAAGSASTVNGESAPGAASAHASSAAAQAAAPAASSGAASAHVWSGSIQQAPAGANGASVAGAEALLAPGAANQMPSGSATQAATGASQARPSSLQQLLALKNRVLMELQKHGIGKPAANLAPPPAPAAGSAQKSQAGAEAGAATSAVAGSETAGSETAGSEAAVGSAAGPATNAASAPAVTSPASVSPRATAPQAPFNMGAAIAVGAAVVALIAGFALRRRKKGPSADAIEPGAFTPAPALDPDAVAAIAGAPAEPEAAEKTHEAGEQGANAAARHALPIVPSVETDKASAKGESMLSSAAGPDLEPAREPHARAAEPLTLKMPQADEPGSAPFAAKSAAKSAAEAAAEAGVPPTGAKPAPYAWRQAFPRDAIAALDSLDMPLPPRESAPDDIGQEVQSQPAEPAGSNASQDATNGQADAHRPIGAEAPREAGALGEAKPVADRNEGEPFDDEMHAARPWVAEPLHATPPGGIEPGEAVARAADSSAIEPLGEAARGQDARSTEPRSFATEAGSTHSAGQQAARAEATEPQAPTPIGAAPDVHERAHEQAHAQRQAGAVPQQAAVPHEAAVPGIELPNAPLTAHVEPPPAAAQPGAAFAAPAPVPASSSSEPAREPAAPSQSPSPNLPPLGVAQFGALNLDFDLELPAGPSASLPAFTPEALAKIARNKLELASEYVELGDLAGARTLLHEVIEAGHADTRDEARVMLAKLADLS